MVNEQLVDLSRAICTAVKGTDFNAEELKGLFLKVVPELLAEIDILSDVAVSALSAAAEMEAAKPQYRNARRRQKRRAKA